MGKPLTDPSITVRTSVLANDIMYAVRPSLGAAGSFVIEVQNFENSLGALVDKYIYVMGGQMLEPQPGGARILLHIPPVDVVIPSASNLSCGKAEVAATNDWLASIKQNGVEIGTMFIAAGSDTPVFNFPSDATIVGQADVVSVVVPATPDATLAGLAFSIYGRR